MFVLARPLHTHGLADGFREEHGVGGRVVGGVRAVRSRSFHEHHAHLLGRESEDARQRGAQSIGHLRRGPYRGRVAADISNGAGRRERRVALARPGIRRGHLRLSRRQRRLERDTGGIAFAERSRRSPMDDRLVAIDDAITEISLEVVVAGQPAPFGPRRLELARSPHGRPFVRRHDREEALDADDTHARQVRDRRLIDRNERGAVRGRADDPPVHHARNGEVLNVLIASRALGWNIGAQRRLSDLRVSSRGHERGFRVNRQRQPAPADQCADPHATPTGHWPHFARDDRQVGNRMLQSLCAEAKEHLASGRRRLTDRRASARQPGASARTTGVRTLRGVAVDDGHPSRIDTELFRRHLRNRDAHAGPDVHLARVDRHRTVGVDGEKAVDFARVERASVAAQRDRRRLLPERRQAAEAEAHDEAARRLEPVAPIHLVARVGRHSLWDLTRSRRYSTRPQQR